MTVTKTQIVLGILANGGKWTQADLVQKSGLSAEHVGNAMRNMRRLQLVYSHEDGRGRGDHYSVTDIGLSRHIAQEINRAQVAQHLIGAAERHKVASTLRAEKATARALRIASRKRKPVKAPPRLSVAVESIVSSAILTQPNSVFALGEMYAT